MIDSEELRCPVSAAVRYRALAALSFIQLPVIRTCKAVHRHAPVMILGALFPLRLFFAKVMSAFTLSDPGARQRLPAANA